MTDRDTQSLHGTHGDVLTAISDGMVALLKEYYGRGPTQAKTYYQDDLVVCLLRGGFTRVEQTLLEGGRGPAVIQQRMEFQELMRGRFVAVIEGATGRRVIGFMSGNQQHPDVMCEVFIRRPFATGDESRNLAWLAPLAFGEAWHNNHHAFPTSAEHGLRRRQVDPSALVIGALERLGLIWNVVRISPERQQSRSA